VAQVGEGVATVPRRPGEVNATWGAVGPGCSEPRSVDPYILPFLLDTVRVLLSTADNMQLKWGESMKKKKARR
jgi:hypothetical protein